MTTKRMLEFVDGIAFYGGYQAPATAALVTGFVYQTTTNYAVANSTASGIIAPIGVVTADYASGSYGVEVRSTGLVWMLNTATVSMTAGDPVFPGAAGRILKTGATDASGNAKLGKRGFGTVIVGAASGGYSLVKLERMN